MGICYRHSRFDARRSPLRPARRSGRKGQHRRPAGSLPQARQSARSTNRSPARPTNCSPARITTTHQSQSPTVHLPDQRTVYPELVEGSLASLLEQAKPGDYLAITLLYARMDDEADRLLGRVAVRRVMRAVPHRNHHAGYGPRYLHSTGQLHKGGSRFRSLPATDGRANPQPRTADSRPALWIRHVLAAAQAIGDYRGAHQSRPSRWCPVNLGGRLPCSGLRRSPRRVLRFSKSPFSLRGRG